MSILIKGVRMPTSCYDCNCFIRDSDGSDYCCLLMQDIEDNNKRDDNCPLVPVSPHGDLIDRDALIKDGWLNLYKEVMRMGGFAIHELPLKNPSIAVIIPAEKVEESET